MDIVWREGEGEMGLFCGIHHIQGTGEGMDSRKTTEIKGESGLWSIMEDK